MNHLLYHKHMVSHEGYVMILVIIRPPDFPVFPVVVVGEFDEWVLVLSHFQLQQLDPQVYVLVRVRVHVVGVFVHQRLS